MHLPACSQVTLMNDHSGPSRKHHHKKGRTFVPLYMHLDYADAHLIALILSARSIPYKLEKDKEEGFNIFVDKKGHNKALKELKLYFLENKKFFKKPKHKKAQLHFKHLKASLLSVLFAACCMSVTFRYDIRPWLLESGAADASKILSGEIYRVITALFLHADPAHFLDNILIGAIFFAILFEETGVGLGWFLVINTGGIGNYLNSLLYQYDHISIGLSTGVFASIGIYCSIRAMKYGTKGAKDAFKVLLSGLALLGFLGTGKGRIDISAHFFGFLAGLVAGVLVSVLAKISKKAIFQHDLLFAGLAILEVAVCWALALSHG